MVTNNELDKLEALARAPMQEVNAVKIEQQLAAFQDAANPATVLQLIQLARRSTGHVVDKTSGSDGTATAGAKGLATILQAAGAMRMVRCHDGSGEPFAAYDKDIADRVVAELRTGVHGLEGRINELRTALREVGETRFGWDGDCGVTKIADDALYADEQAGATSGSDETQSVKVDEREFEVDRIALYWTDQARKGCADAFSCGLREMWGVARAAMSASQGKTEEAK